MMIYLIKITFFKDYENQNQINVVDNIKSIKPL